MSKSQESGCLGHILVYVFFISIPALAIGFLGLNDSYIFAYVICLMFSFFLSLFLFADFLSKVKNDSFTNVLHAALVMLLTIIMLVVYTVVFDVDVYEDPKDTPTHSNATSARRVTTAATATPARNYDDNSVPLYYQRYYPTTWGYIKKYSSDPYTYVKIYDLVWGDLQECHGDGIIFDTLSWYEQTLVHYPGVDDYIYLASYNGTEYHSMPVCYTLLRSSPVSVQSKYAYKYDPCSKCVGD